MWWNTGYTVMRDKDHTFRLSLLRALDEGRVEDLIFLLANRMRSRRITISRAARAALPVHATDSGISEPRSLSEIEIETFGIRDTGWHLLALVDKRIIGAEILPFDPTDADSLADLQSYSETISAYYGATSEIFCAYHADGVLRDFRDLETLTAKCGPY
jgi:hypothetical protein